MYYIYNILHFQELIGLGSQHTVAENIQLSAGEAYYIKIFMRVYYPHNARQPGSENHSLHPADIFRQYNGFSSEQPAGVFYKTMILCNYVLACQIKLEPYTSRDKQDKHTGVPGENTQHPAENYPQYHYTHPYIIRSFHTKTPLFSVGRGV